MESSLGLPSSSEYLAAMELEMWKLSQEEAFGNQLRTKEREYLHKLGEEWRKREAERQKVFTQKVAASNDNTCLFIFMGNKKCVVYRLSCNGNFIYVHVHVHVCYIMYILQIHIRNLWCHLIIYTVISNSGFSHITPSLKPGINLYKTCPLVFSA